MKKTVFIMLFLALITTLFSVNLPRTPAISPDGKWIVFSLYGDIWRMELSERRAYRITDNVAHEFFPKISPDGKWIAFSSKRYGNYDVYVVSSKGGIPVRLTYRDTDDIVNGWTPDGRYILFHSRGALHHFYRNINVFVVKRTGGTPFPFVNEVSKYADVSADGNFILFNYGTAPELRKGYRGPANIEVYLYNRKNGEYSNISKFSGNDKWPKFCLSKDEVVFVSDRGKEGVFNLWKYSIENNKFTQLTFFKNGQVRYPECGGGKIVFEYKNGLYLYEKGNVRELPIEAAEDYKVAPFRKTVFTKNAEIMKPSPSGEEVAFIVRGDVFVMDKEGKRIRNITNSASREIDIEWSSDGKSLFVSSDRNGNYDIFVYESNDPEEQGLSRALVFKSRLLVGKDKDEKGMKLSPDGKTLAFIRGKGTLVLFNLKDGKEKVLIKGWSEPSYSWSPDSKWIAFSREDNNFNSDVYIISAEGGKAYNISQHPDIDTNPVFSQDGTRLYFVSRRFDNNMDIWMVFLEKRLYDMDELEKEEEIKKINKELKEGKKPVNIKIDFDGINRRVQHITKLLGSETEIHVLSGGEKIIFSANDDKGRNLWIADWNGKNIKKLTKDNLGARGFSTDKEGKNVYFLRNNGTISYLSTSGLKVKKIPFKAKVEIKRMLENSQKYDEAWRVLNTMFYDKNFHGVNWRKKWKYYRDWAIRTQTVEDFNYVFTMLLGELNSSHQGIRSPRNNKVKTGYLGVYFDEKYKGDGLRVKKVLKYSPAARVISKLYKGDVILAVNGMKINKNTNIYKLLEDKKDEEVLLKVKRGKSVLSIKIVPFGYRELTTAVYKNIVDWRRKIVEKLSDGKFTYIHIRAMGTQNARDFEEELYSIAEGKEGLIIDVRNNGGGWITDLLLTMLMLKNHAITIPRDGGKGYPQGRRLLYTWPKPIVVLCNENSYSNAEIFSWSIRTLNRGYLVGEKTFGAVISTGAYTLIDGSYVRVPFRGWYVNDGTFTNMERDGCPPDYRVKYKLGSLVNEKDDQLLKAIDVLKKEVLKAKKDPRWPIWLPVKR